MKRVLAVATLALLLLGCRDKERAPKPGVRAPQKVPAARKSTELHVASTRPSEGEADAYSGASMAHAGGAGAASVEEGEAKPAEGPPPRLPDATAPVFLARNLSAYHLAQQLMAQASPTFGAETPILLTPNVGGITWFSSAADDRLRGRITDPEFVRGVIDFLIERGARKITLGVSWGVGKPKAVAEMLRRSGYRELADRYSQVRLVDLFYYGGQGADDALSKPVVVPLPNARRFEHKLTLPKIYLEHQREGLVINLPKLKTHRFAVLTAGTKNLMGILGVDDGSESQLTKWKMHRELGIVMRAVKKGTRSGEPKSWAEADYVAYAAAGEAFSQRLADVYEVARPHLTLIDGALASDGDGFNSLSSVPIGVGIASRNTVYADVVAARLVGLWRSAELKLATGFDGPLGVTAAMQRFYGGLDREISIQGAELPKEDLSLSVELMNERQLRGKARSTLASRELSVIPAFPELPSLRALRDRFPWSPAVYLRDWSGERLPPGMSTAVAVYQGPAGLSFAVRATTLGKETRPREGPPALGQDVQGLYRWDNLEFFIDPTPETPQEYFEIEVSPEGEVLDIHIEDGPSRFDISWSSRARVQVSEAPVLGGRIWVTLVTIPFEAMGIPAPGIAESLDPQTPSPKVNFYRTERYGKERVYSSWQPLSGEKPNFHQPEAFGELRLVGH